MIELMRGLAPSRFVPDGELVIPEGENLSFDGLQMRLHPAESRIRKLAKETPAMLILFDVLVTPAGENLLDTPLVKRRRHLEGFTRRSAVRRV